ncbi:MAG: hypothetical protein ABIG89_01980 [Candidatus Woesearchaeota archaeon]
MKKRGIVTPFIIAGIVFLVAVGLFVMMRNYSYTSTYVPAPLVPITTHTKECLQQSAEDGLFFLKTQGGYIYLPKTIDKDRDAYLNMGLKIPYWFYKFQDRTPTINDMELDLEKYVKENVIGCINNFNNFPEFEVVDIVDTEFIDSKNNNNNNNNNNLKVDVSINKHDVTVNIDIPVRLKTVQKKVSDVYRFPKLQANINTDLGSMHKLAMTIMKTENKDSFLEKYVYDMVASSDYLPHEGMEITCEPRVWKISDIDENLKQVITHNIQFLTFKNTKYEESGIPYFDKIYNIDLKAGDFSNIRVKTIYNPKWPLNLDVYPKDNDRVKPLDFVPAKFFFNCIKLYHHKYSVEFPILFQLIANDNPDDMFYFATPVIMKRDEPNRYGEVPAWPEEIDKVGSAKYCSNTTSLSIFNVDKAGNIIVQPSMQDNRKVKLFVHAIDKTKGYDALNDVKISYHCVKFRCDIGMTELPKTDGYYVGDTPMLEAKFPYCFNGYIIAEKQGYLTARKQITINDDSDGASIDVEMSPLKEFDFEVKVIEEKNNMINERSMVNDEAAIIMISSKENNYEQTLFYPLEMQDEETKDSNSLSTLSKELLKENIDIKQGTKNDTFDPYKTLKIIAGKDNTYNVEIKLVDNEKVLGGAAYNWTPNYSQITTNSKVIFYVTKKDTGEVPLTAEDMKKQYEESLEKSKLYQPKMID